MVCRGLPRLRGQSLHLLGVQLDRTLLLHEHHAVVLLRDLERLLDEDAGDDTVRFGARSRATLPAVRSRSMWTTAADSMALKRRS